MVGTMMQRLRTFTTVNRKLKLAGVLWLVFVIFPAALVALAEPGHGDQARLVSRWFGVGAARYLSAAPSGLVSYVLGAGAASILAVLLIAESARTMLAKHVGVKPTLVTWVKSYIAWVALYVSGIVAVGIIHCLRAADVALEWGWVQRLALYGAFSELPVLGVAMLALSVTHRLWLSRLMCIAVVLATFVWGAMAKIAGLDSWAPAVASSKLFSGRPELISEGFRVLLAWVGSIFLAAAVVYVARRLTHQRRADAAEPSAETT